MGFLTLSSLGIKLISFFLVPLYTSILSTAEYGTYDLFNTTVSLLIPFLTLNIKESTIRFSLSSEYEKKDVFSISLQYGIYSVIVFGIFIIVNHIWVIVQPIEDYKWLVLLMFISQVAQGVLTNFIRGLDRLKEIAISSVVCSLVIVSLNIIFLLPLHMGLTGYFIANIIGPMIQSLYLFIMCKGWKYISFAKRNKYLNKEMIHYSVPMIANSTAWWINSVSDRYIIIWLCGVAENGIYSVASKIPSLVDMFQGIFSQAWTLSAVKEFDSEDTNGFFSKMYSIYNMCMTLTSGLLIMFSRLLARFLYAKDFFEAWRYVPFLTIAVLFGALAGYCGAIFSAVKASKMFAYSTMVGAMINIGLNCILINRLGALGAAIATAISYAVIYWLRLVTAKKFIKLKLNLIRDWIGYSLLIIQTVLFLVIENECWQLYIVQILLVSILVLLFKEQLHMILIKAIELIKKVNNKDA